MRRGSDLTLLALLCALCLFAPAHAQRHPLDVPDPTQKELPQRQRLILKDGSYQIVLSYKVAGSVVQYRSAERSGEQEEIPLTLVDLPATERWKREHSAGAQNLPPVLSPELAKEEALAPPQPQPSRLICAFRKKTAFSHSTIFTEHRNWFHFRKRAVT